MLINKKSTLHEIIKAARENENVPHTEAVAALYILKDIIGAIGQYFIKTEQKGTSKEEIDKIKEIFAYTMTQNPIKLRDEHRNYLTEKGK